MKPSSFFLIFFVSLTPAVLAAENESSGGPDFADGLYARKMYASAVPEYEKFIRQNPSSTEMASARFRASDARYFMRNYRGAAEGFEDFVRDFPSDRRVMLARFREGASRYHLKNYPAAESLFLKVIKGSDEPALKSGALFYLARIMEARGLKERGLELFKKLIRLYPGTDYASYAGLIVAEDLLKKGEPEDALRLLGAVTESKAAPEAAEGAWLRIADIHFAAKNDAAAKDACQKAFDLASSEEVKGEALLRLFMADSRLQDLESFRKRLDDNRALVRSSGHEPEVTYLLADVLSAKDAPGAIAAADAVLSDASASSELKQKASLKKSTVLSSEGKNEEALKELSGVMTHAEGEIAAAAKYQAGLVNLKLGKTEAAEKLFGDYAKEHASHENAPKALLQVAQIHLDAGDFATAAHITRDVAQAYPKSAARSVAFYKLGVAETGLKRHREAAEAFSHVVAEGRGTPLYADALYGAAICLENAGDTETALSHYETLVREFPEHTLGLQATPHIAFLYLNARRLDKLSAFYEEALFKRPSAPIDMDAVFWLIQYLIDEKKYEELQRLLGALPARFPGQDLAHEIHFFNGESQMGLKNYNEAAISYAKALQAQKNGAYAAHAHLGLGITEAAMGRTEQAEREFNEALVFEDKAQVVMRARFEIANLRLKTGHLQEAAKAFMLVAIFYDDARYVPGALYKAGECFLSLKKPEEAAQAFQELQRRYPQSEWAQKSVAKAA